MNPENKYRTIRADRILRNAFKINFNREKYTKEERTRSWIESSTSGGNSGNTVNNTVVDRTGQSVNDIGNNINNTVDDTDRQSVNNM